MAKLPRFTQKVFGSTAGANEIAEYGSLAAGTPNRYSGATITPALVQTLGNYLAGWKAAVEGSFSPAIEDMNALCYLFAYQLAYMFQAGIPEYDAATIYYIGSMCNSGGVIYVSLTDNNVGNALTAPNWKVLSTFIEDGSVTTAKLADGAVTTVKLEDLSVTDAKLAASSVNNAKLADGSVTTAKIVDANITASKIADANVITSKIADSNVTGAKIETNINLPGELSRVAGAQIMVQNGSGTAIAVIRGQVSNVGAPNLGEGYGSSRQSQGIYLITFVSPFDLSPASGEPTAVASCIYDGGVNANPHAICLQGPATATTMIIYTTDASTGAAIDSAFNFVIIGKRV